MRRDKNTMNPFEKLANERNNEDKNNKEKTQEKSVGRIPEDLQQEAVNEDEKADNKNDLIEENEDEDVPLTLPPPVNTYFLVVFFAFFVVFMTVIFIAPTFLSSLGYGLFGLTVGLAVRFVLSFALRKIFAEPYVDKHLEPFFTEIYDDLFSRKDLIKLVESTSKVIRKRYVDKDRLMTASVLKKDGVKYIMVSGISQDKKVGLALTADGEPVVTASDAFFQKKVFKLLVNGFHGFWDSNLGVPSEFTSVSEDGVFKGTIIFETLQQANRFSTTQETLSEDDVVSLGNRGEMFRFLEIASKVGLDTMVVMQDGTKFSAAASSLFYEFQNSSSS